MIDFYLLAAFALIARPTETSPFHQWFAQLGHHHLLSCAVDFVSHLGSHALQFLVISAQAVEISKCSLGDFDFLCKIKGNTGICLSLVHLSNQQDIQFYILSSSSWLLRYFISVV